MLFYLGYCLKVSDNTLDKAFCYKSDNNGASWNEVSGLDGIVNKVFSIADGRLLAVVYDSAETKTSIFISDDDGITWETSHEVDAVKSLSLARNETTGHIYLFGGSPGVAWTGIVLFSSDNGDSWSEYSYSGSEETYIPFPDATSSMVEDDYGIIHATIMLPSGY